MTLNVGLLKNAATRPVAAQKRAELLLALSRGESVSINFDEITRVTPSFVDELLGKLVMEIGLEEFSKRIVLSGVTEPISNLISTVLAGRAKQAHGTQAASAFAR